MPDYADIPRIKIHKVVAAFPIPYLDKTAWDLAQWLKDIDLQYPGAKIGGIEEYEVDPEGRVVRFLKQPPAADEDDQDGDDWGYDNWVECLEVHAEVWETDEEYEHRASRIRRQRQQAARRQEQAAAKRAQAAARREAKEREELARLLRKHGVPEGLQEFL